MMGVVNTVGRYLAFYLGLVFLFSLYSTLLDLLLYRLDHGGVGNYGFAPLAYFIYFGIGYIFPALPVAILYNYVINNVFANTYVRLIIGLLLGLAVGFLIQEGGVSFYIGPLRSLKNIILYGLIGITIELLRILVVYFMNKKTVT